MMERGFQEPAIRGLSLNPTRVVLTGARSVFIGPNLIFETYRTAVATIVFGLDADIKVHRIEEPAAAANPQPVLVIPPDTLCELHAEGNIALLFCDALSDDYTEIDLRGLLLLLKPMLMKDIGTTMED